MLTRKPEAMGDRVFGSESLFEKRLGVEAALTLSRHITVAFLAVFGILLIMMVWAYTKVRVAALPFCVTMLTPHRYVQPPQGSQKTYVLRFLPTHAL